MKRVLINTNFKDVYTGEMYIAGHYENMTSERIEEIKKIDPNFVTVVGAGNPEITEVEVQAVANAIVEQATEDDKTNEDVVIESVEESTEKPTVEELVEELEEDTEEIVEEIVEEPIKPSKNKKK